MAGEQIWYLWVINCVGWSKNDFGEETKKLRRRWFFFSRSLIVRMMKSQIENEQKRNKFVAQNEMRAYRRVKGQYIFQYYIVLCSSHTHSSNSLELLAI